MAFACAAGVIVLWLATEPFLGFSDTWQLIINTSTTIVTFLMVFVIQTSQNQDTIAIQLKLDELICIHKHASNSFIDLEELGEAELSKIRKRYEALADDARNRGEGADSAFPPG
ncbi:low affinity iron permease family protein [Planctellipticum variicoloris]|nr:low affinity iron permease family protein [Planctomycetaceae bacterium SH412]